MFIIDYDNGRFLNFKRAEAELYDFDCYTLGEDGTFELVDTDWRLTRGEVKKYRNGKELLECIERYYSLEISEEERQTLRKKLFEIDGERR